MSDRLNFHKLRVAHFLNCAPMLILVFRIAFPGWIKVNTDGAFGALGLADYGGIFGTYKGSIKGCFTTSMVLAFAYEFELMTVLYVIDFAKKFNWDFLWL